MDCNIIRDLLPLYIDGCCSEESKSLVNKHITTCDSCKKLFEDMKIPSDRLVVSGAPITLSRLNDWKASVLQSALLFLSFALITVGVSLEAGTPSGIANGFWAFNLVVPATGFMLSLANWYFVRMYKSRKRFSGCSLMATLLITLCAYVWSVFHYEIDFFALLGGCSLVEFLDALQGILVLNGFGIILTAVFCILSKVLSDRYAKMLGKG